MAVYNLALSAYEIKNFFDAGKPEGRYNVTVKGSHQGVEQLGVGSVRVVDSAISSQSSNASNSTLSPIPTTIRVPTPPPTPTPAITSNLPPLFISGTTYSGLPLADGTIVEALVGGFIVGSDVVTNGKN